VVVMMPARCREEVAAARDDEITRLVNEELRHRDPRSAEYRLGMLDSSFQQVSGKGESLTMPNGNCGTP
jgi:hypothetical protein